MNTSRIKASKVAMARIRAMSTEELTQKLREKKSGFFAQAIREIADFSDVEYDFNYRTQLQSSMESMVDVEFSYRGTLASKSPADFFDDLKTYEAANELLAA